jgi:ABC-type polysaccharide/polyol phosphate transport system ATPase subunit
VPGLDPEETGRENLITGGLLLGMDRDGVERRIARIASESGLDDYVDLPVRTYSTGMQVRLGFALAIMMDADILLLDEALVTTDAEFLGSMRRRLDAHLRAEAIAVIASHDAGLLRAVCNKGVLLRAGRLLEVGPIEEVLELHHRAAIA